LPDGEDPDTFARKVGEAGVRGLLDQARPLTEHLFFTLLPEGGAATFEAKMQALDRLKPVCSALAVGLVRSAFFGAMASHFRLPAAELEAQLKGKAAPLRPTPRPGESAPPQARPARERPPDVLEASYAAAVLADRRLVQREDQRLQAELSHLGLRALLEAVAAGERPDDAVQEASQPVQQALEQAAPTVPEGASDRETWFRKVCQKLRVRKIEERLAQIARLTAQLPQGELTEETRALQSERVELLAHKKRVLEEDKAVIAGTKPAAVPF
jgi:DNA primase